MRELAALALTDQWSLATARTMVEGDIGEVVAAYEAGLIPLCEAEPKLDGKGMSDLRTWLKPIGMKIRPDMSDVAKTEWLTAVALALSDFPAKVAVQAARNAIRVPIKFLSEVDGVVREEAERIMQRHANALWRLKMLQRDIDDAAKPKLEAPVGYENGKSPPLTLDQLKAMARSEQGRALLSMGLRLGHVVQVDYDTAMASVEVEEDDGGK